MKEYGRDLIWCGEASQKRKHAQETELQELLEAERFAEAAWREAQKNGAKREGGLAFKAKEKKEKT